MYSSPDITYRDGERVQRQFLQRRRQHIAAIAFRLTNRGTEAIFYSVDIGLEFGHV